MWKRPRALNLLRLKSATPTSIVEKPLGLGIHRTTPSSLYRSPSLSRCSPSPCRRFSSLFTPTVFSTSVGSFIESAGSSVSDFFPVPSHTETETGAERERVSLTGIVHKVWQGVYQKGDVLVDATLGKGRDTIELARLANLFTTSSSSSSPSDEVRLIGFDIQAEAVELTRENLRGEFDSDEAEGWQCSQIALYHCSHSELSARLAECGINPGDVGIVCFNLGYLPGGGDGKRVITTGASTVSAVRQSLSFLRPGGVVSLLCYVGHTGGRAEYEMIQTFIKEELLQNANPSWEVHEYDPKEMAPKIIILQKKE